MKDREFHVLGERFAAKNQAFNRAIRIINAATIIGQMIGAALSIVAWWLSGAPWWAIPLFVTVVGWAGGKAYGIPVARREERKIKAEFPEVLL